MNEDPERVFTLLKVIGKGSFGQVFKAINNRTKEVVAIKQLDMESEDDDIEEMQKEIALLSHCDCDNITKYYGSFMVKFKLWIVMDYCSIGSIRTLMKSGPITEKHISVISRDVLNALNYLHRNNIIHRDIKAANILMTERGIVKMCDFGVAGRLSLSNLKRHSFVGTPYWMAPEVIKRSGYDYKADIWSFGITVYEMAVGHPPHIQLDPMKAILKIPKAEPPRLAGGNFSKILCDFVAVCLNDDPASRPNADELMKHKFIKQVKKGNRELMDLISRHQEWLSRQDDDDGDRLNNPGDSNFVENLEQETIGGMSDEGWDFETAKRRSKVPTRSFQDLDSTASEPKDRSKHKLEDPFGSGDEPSDNKKVNSSKIDEKDNIINTNSRSDDSNPQVENIKKQFEQFSFGSSPSMSPNKLQKSSSPDPSNINNTATATTTTTTGYNRPDLAIPLSSSSSPLMDRKPDLPISDDKERTSQHRSSVSKKRIPFRSVDELASATSNTASSFFPRSFSKDETSKFKANIDEFKMINESDLLLDSNLNSKKLHDELVKHAKENLLLVALVENLLNILPE